MMFEIAQDGTLLDFKPAKDFPPLVPPSMFLGKSLSEVLPVEVSEQAMRSIERALETGEAQVFEYPLSMNGQAREYEARIVASGQGRTLAIVRDITERKRAEEAQRQSAERLETLREIDQAVLVAESPEAIAQAALRHIRQLVPSLRASIVVFDLDAKEATVLAVRTDRQTQVGARTRVALEAFGALEELRQGKAHTVDDVLMVSESSAVVEALKAEGVRCYANIPLVAQGEVIGSLNLGADRPAAFTAEQIDIAREVADQLAIAIQQARMREELQRHAAQLEQRVAERTAELWEVNAELESFAYTVTHDLRAPLRAMQGFSDALLEDHSQQLDAVGQDYARRIVRAAERMDALICDLLAYSRLSRADLDLRPVSLQLVVVDVLSQLGAELQQRGAQVVVAGPLPEVIGHRTTLAQVITNLLANAIKFVTRGASPEVQVWAEERDQWVRLWIEDNGIGIAPEHHERIFRVFERLHGMETYPGTGIGLAIVHKGVERMKGQVGVESEVGKGSRFWLELQKA
jgi:signal transduction histidine kinase